MKDDLIIDLLNRALECDIGLWIETNNVRVLNNALSDMKKHSDKWASLMICIPSIDNHILIVHKSVELDG